MIGSNDWSHIWKDRVSEHFTYTYCTLNIQLRRSARIPAAADYMQEEHLNMCVSHEC